MPQRPAANGSAQAFYQSLSYHGYHDRLKTIHDVFH
jgi:hypothetical protein